MERIFPVKKQGDKNVNCFKPTPFSSERIVLNLLEKRLNFSYNPVFDSFETIKLQKP